MNRKSDANGYSYYICETYKNYGSCTKHSIREDELAEIVYKVIQQQIDMVIEMSELVKSIQDTPVMKKKDFNYLKLQM